MRIPAPRFLDTFAVRGWGSMQGPLLCGLLAVTMAGTVGAADAPSQTVAIPARFDSAGADRHAIEALLDAYTKAVSTKDEPAFEALLLSKTIPFAYVPEGATLPTARIANYQEFRRGVFEGAPFRQRFTNVRIEQDGNLASVTLVFINTRAQEQSWGWKTLHLLKSAGGWKIASEFFTSHS